MLRIASTKEYAAVQYAYPTGLALHVMHSINRAKSYAETQTTAQLAAQAAKAPLTVTDSDNVLLFEQ